MHTVKLVQVKDRASKGKGGGKYTPPDVEAQAEEGALDRPKNSGEDYGVMSARGGNWDENPRLDRCALMTLAA